MQGTIINQEKGFNPVSMSNGIVFASTTSASNVTIASVTGSGFISSISQGVIGTGGNSSDFRGYITLVIDGVTVINDEFISRRFENGGWTKSCIMKEVHGNLLAGFIKFNSNFTLYHRTNSTSCTIRTNLGYKLNWGIMQGIIVNQNSGFNPKIMTPNMLIAGTTSTGNVTILNISGSGLLTSLSQSLRSTDTVTGSNGFVTVVIDGSTILNDAPLSYSGEHGGWTSTANSTQINDNIIYGLFKFNSSLVIYHRTDYAASYTYTYVGYLLN